MNNLVNDPWIPVLFRTGAFTELSIKDTLINASSLQISPRNPMDKISLFRFLLSLCYWCYDQTGESFPANDDIPQSWLKHLADNSQYFNLFGEGKRFLQDRKAERMRPSTDLIQEVPAGNNFWHFNHSSDYRSGLCPVCCINGLLRIPLFAVSGLPNLKSGINGVPPVYAILWTHNLMDTLRANWFPSDNMGIPAWVDPTIFPCGQMVPLLNGLTMLPRRVLLHEAQGSAAACSSCGRKSNPLIYSCFLENAGSISNPAWQDPHVFRNPETGFTYKAPDPVEAGKFVMDKPWHDSLANYLASTPNQVSAKLLLVGLSTQQAKYIDVWEQELDLPIGDIPDGNIEAVCNWKKELHFLIKQLNKEIRSRDQGRPFFYAVSPNAEHLISKQANTFARADIPTWQEASQIYRPAMKLIAKSIFPGKSLKAYRLRYRISQILPKLGKPTLNPANTKEVANDQH